MKTVKFVIPVHSFIDVVTNSSTSIYVGCHSNTIQYAKDLIDELLKASGSDKKAEDVFDFHLGCDFDNEYEYRLQDKVKEYFPEVNFEETDEDEKEKLAKEIFEKILSGKLEEYADFGCGYEGGNNQRTLLITSKDGEVNINLTEMMQKIFSIEADYDG